MCDYKGNNVLCGRKGSHSLNMNSLWCNYNIYPRDGDNTYIGPELECDHLTVNDIDGQTREHNEPYSFLPINNFSHVFLLEIFHVVYTELHQLKYYMLLY